MSKLSAKEIGIDQLPDFYDSLSREVMKNHERRFSEASRAVREASSSLENAAVRFSSGVKNAWGTLDKTASEYGMRLAQMVQEASGELARRETGANYHTAEKFHQETVESLNEIIVTVRRYIPKLHKALKPEMSALNSGLVKLEKSVKALGTALDESPGQKFEAIERDVQIITQSHDQLLRLRGEEEQVRHALERASEKDRAVMSERDGLVTHHEFLELMRYEESISSKEAEIKQLLQPLTKPLLKLERTILNRQAPAIDTKTLRNLVEKPIETVVTGQAFAINDLLSSLQTALERGEWGIEERKRKRAEETIKAIKENRMQKLREEYLALQANTQETLRQLRAKGLIEKRDSLNRMLSENRSEVELLISKQRELQRKMDELAKSLLKHKTALESDIFKASHKAIIVRAD